jgi:hypothetical protein
VAHPAPAPGARGLPAGDPRSGGRGPPPARGSGGLLELLRALAALAEPPSEAQERVAPALGLAAPDAAAPTEVFTLQLPPYASVYLGGEGMLGGEARDRVAGFLRALGVTPPAPRAGRPRGAPAGAPPGGAGGRGPRPRGVENFDSSDTYPPHAAEVARGQGATTPPTVTQVFRTDVDGDGTDEVVVAAEHISDPDGLTPAGGDWSIVFLRRVVGDDVVSDVLAASVVGGDGGGSLERIQVSTVADLNGDGRLELVLSGRSGAGEWTAVQALAGDDMTSGMAEVLRSGCEG